MFCPGGILDSTHLDHRLLDGCLASPVAVDDRRREPQPLELGRVQCDVAGGGGECAAVVARAVGLALRRALVALGSDEVVALFGQEGVQGVLDGSPHEFRQIALYGVVANCYDGCGHG